MWHPVKLADARWASRSKMPSSRKQSFKSRLRSVPEILQVKPAGDPSPPKPYPTWVGVGRKPPAQDVADHARPAGLSLAPRPHRSLVNRLVSDGKVEPFPSADMLDQRLLKRTQPAEWHLSDHTGTLVSMATTRSARRRSRLNPRVPVDARRLGGGPPGPSMHVWVVSPATVIPKLASWPRSYKGLGKKHCTASCFNHPAALSREVRAG